MPIPKKRLKVRDVAMLLLAAGLLGIAAVRIDNYLKMRRELIAPPAVTPPGKIRTLPGFKISLLHTASRSEGSWISMTIDPQGRLLVASESTNGLLRLTIADGKLAGIEPLATPINSAMGLLYAGHSLFLDGGGPKGWGIYRMLDSNGVFGPPALLRSLDITLFEHGSHGMLVGPGGKLYVVCGNHTAVPSDVAPSSPWQNYREEQLFPHEADPEPYGNMVGPAAGYVMRMDLNGNNCELFAGGTRNTYNVAFNPDGELFGFDGDSERDIGLPWYRPVRVNHWVSGADFGFRRGNGVIPEYDEDTLPATLNVGLGSPTAVKFASTNFAFPARYRDDCFMADWAYGRLFAVRFIPHGATYDATIETLLRGIPLNITAMEFGLDGALYFITGGRDTQSALYRLSWNGPNLTAPPKTTLETAREQEAAAARRSRRQLESFHGRNDSAAVDVIWPSLRSDDRWIRYAARVALEFQDLDRWRQRALRETNTYGGLTALLALARCGKASAQPELFSALERFSFSQLSEDQQLLKLRVMELSIIRQGRPSADLTARIVGTLAPLYPSTSRSVNHELCQLLLALDAPTAIGKTLALLHQATVQEEQIYYAECLRNTSNGWTLPQREDYLGWFRGNHSQPRLKVASEDYFKDVGLDYCDGAEFDGYFDNFWHEASATLNDAEHGTLASYLPPARTPPPIPKPAPRKFVKIWRMADLAPDLSRLERHQPLARGWNVFMQAQCGICHRFAGNGGAFALSAIGTYGPDLTAVGSRMSGRDILQSILEPSAAIADEYRNTTFTLKDGDVLSGRWIGETDKDFLLLVDPVALTHQYIPKADVVSHHTSKISPMPEGLLDSFTEDEIWGLVALLKNGGHNSLTNLPKFVTSAK
jgi:putative heme-binding domain-containing protein